MKKVISLFLSIVMLLSITAGIDFSAYATTSGDFEYEVLDDGTAEITYYSGSASTLTIPSTLGGYTVTSIGDEAFCYRSLTSVTIPDGVTSIGYSAFEGCNLTGITIPNSVTSIDAYAFSDCSSLTSVTFGDSLTSIEYGAFAWCYELTSITIPDSVTSIGESVFYGCSNLTSIEVGSNNANYSSQNGVLFDKNKTELIQYPAGNTRTAYTIPDSVTSIDENAFYGSSSLTSVTLGDNLENIGSRAFCDCTSLTSITIPENVTSIGSYTFYGCCALTSVTLGENLKSIGRYAFGWCYGLTSITIPNSVTSIYYDAFYGCSNLTSISVDSNNANYSSQDGVLFNKDKTKLIQYPAGNTRTSYSMPKTVTSIEYSAFADCYALTSVTLGENLKSIGYSAFSCCDGLTSITIPDSVTSIGSDAFYYCTGLTSITIPDSVTSMGGYAFYGCSSLKNAVIGNGLTEIEYGVFCWCENLTNVTIGNNVSSIEWDAFYGCSSLKSITIPENVTSIGGYAFYGCSSLKSITILNPSCELYDDDDWWEDEETGERVYEGENTIPDTATIYGYANSTAQAYADKFNRKFVELGTHTHTYGNGVVTKAATCSATGVKTYTCTVCGATKTETIAKTAHTYKNVVTKATLSKNGKITPTCTVCGATKSATTIYYAKTIKLSKTSYTYDGKTHKPSVTVTDSKGNTISSKYYDVTYASGRKKIGEYKVTVKFKGNYSGTKTLYFTIDPKISLSKTSYTYDGKTHKPSVTVKDSSGNTISTKNYTISYSKGRKSVGKYTVTIKFKNGHSGTYKKTFTIKPRSTSISKVTAKSKGFTVKWKKQSTQTTGYQIQYSTSKDFSNAKTVTVTKNSTTSKTISKLKAKKKYYVRVRTYKTVKVNGKSTKIYSSWSSAKTVTTKK